jgi:NAD(P)-dependent dehydrogenase (short-subunit alcohol dehydrogenase family)
MRGLNGKRVVVTGGASGIGRATVIRLAEEGCIVGIFDLDAKGSGETVAMCAAGSGKAAAYQVDIADYKQVEDAARRFEADFGPVDLLANIAGWDKASPFLESDVALWNKIIAINLYGPLNVQHVIVRGMAQRKYGRVVNVASDAGRVGSSGEAVYSACKGGIAAFTKTLAREKLRYAKRGMSRTDRYATAAIVRRSETGRGVGSRNSFGPPRASGRLSRYHRLSSQRRCAIHDRSNYKRVRWSDHARLASNIIFVTLEAES